MTDESDGPGRDGYDPAAIEVLHGLASRRRPWQQLLPGNGQGVDLSATADPVVDAYLPGAEEAG